MSVRGLYRGASQKGFATPTNAPIRVDDTTQKIYVNTGGSGSTETELRTVVGATPIVVTAATVTLGATHKGRATLFNRAAGIVATLPAATGSGDIYEIILIATATGATTIAVPNATDYMIGTAVLFQDGGDTVVGFATANTGTVATESDTLTLFATGNTTGGIKGAKVVFRDIATAIWQVEYISDAGGTEVTPFSAGV